MNFTQMLSGMPVSTQDELADVSGHQPMIEWADDDFKKAAAHLEVQRVKAIAQLGTKWIVHPSHMREKLDLPPNTLGKNS
jgi:hypothetical protein